MIINLLGAPFILETTEDPAHMERVIHHYRAHVEDVRDRVQSHGPLRLAILAGLQAVDEYLKSQQHNHTPSHTSTDNRETSDMRRHTPTTTHHQDNIDGEHQREAEKITNSLMASIDRIIDL